jgi:hypothetical protein
VGDPNGPPLRRPEVLDALKRHGVEFVLVGGQAGAVHGAERRTFDLDICVRWSKENLDRVGDVLVELDAGLRLEDMDEPFPVPHRDAEFLDTMEISTWRSTRGDIDILRGIPGHGHEVAFDELASRAETFRVDGHEVSVADLSDIITSKETLGRPPDLDALPELRSLAENRRP